MKEEDFDQLVASIRQSGAIRRGEMKPSRVSEVAPDHVKAIHQRLDESQSEFALMIGVSVPLSRTGSRGERSRKVQRVPC